MIRQTHTFVTLEISPTAYKEISDKLREANYVIAFTRDDVHGEAMDMHGIALVQGKEPQERPLTRWERCKPWVGLFFPLALAFASFGILWLWKHFL